MKTVRWGILKKKIPSLQGELNRFIKDNPGFTQVDVANYLNNAFEKELKQLNTKITKGQINVVIRERGYKEAVVDFMKNVSGLKPKDIDKIFKLKIPETNYKKPFMSPAKDSDNPRVCFINAPMIGLGPENEILKRALITAERRKADKVVIPGNLVWLDTKRYSNTKPNKAEFSIELEDDKLIFRPFKDKFDFLVQKFLQRQFFDENGKPYFKGEVLISLGKTEMELIGQYTNEIIRQATMKRERALRGALSALNKELRKAERIEDEKLIRELNERADAITEELSFVKMTNANDGYLRKISKEMRKYIIYVYEKALNAKVISCGEVHLDVSGLTIQGITDVRDSSYNKIVKQMLSRFRGIAKHYDLPHIICAAGRTNDIYTGTPISYLQEGERPAETYVEQLPCCIDNKPLKRIKGELLRVGDSFLDAVSSPGLVPGIVLYHGIREKRSGELLVKREIYDLDFFNNDELFNGKKWNISDMAYFHLEGDMHTGSPFVAIYEIPKHPHFRYHFQISYDFLTQLNAPIIGYINLGDIIQGHNHPFELSLPREIKPFHKLLKMNISRKKLFMQVLKRGIFPSEDQIEEFTDAAFNGYEDYFLRIIQRAKREGVEFKGDLAPIIFLGGNHYINTTEGEANEGLAVARVLRSLLRTRIMDCDPETLIKSPRFGREPIGRGTVRFLRGKEFAIVVRHKGIAGAAKYDDQMRRLISASSKRGVYDDSEKGRFTFQIMGHSHMGGFAHTNDSSYDVCGSQTFHDPFGDKLGFPLNYIASLIKGIPKKGLAWGPIIGIPLSYSFFKRTTKFWKEWDIERKNLFEFS